MKQVNGLSWITKGAVVITVLMLAAFLLVACGDSSPDENGAGSDSPRTDTPLYPGAEFVYERTYSVAVEELYAADATVAEVIAYYAGFPEFERLPETTQYFGDTEGAYLETELFSLLKQGDEEAVRNEAAESGALLYLMILPSDAEDQLTNMLGLQELPEEIPAGSTIISLRILTGD